MVTWTLPPALLPPPPPPPAAAHGCARPLHAPAALPARSDVALIEFIRALNEGLARDEKVIVEGLDDTHLFVKVWWAVGRRECVKLGGLSSKWASCAEPTYTVCLLQRPCSTASCHVTPPSRRTPPWRPSPAHCGRRPPQADRLEFVRTKVAEWQQSLRYEPKKDQQ